MSTIDDRIVSLKFDNAQFQSKIADTLASIDQLNSKLANVGAGNGLSLIHI